MELTVEAVNHVCIVVRDMEAANRFYIDVLGLKRHHVVSSWLLLNQASTLHLVNIPEAEFVESLYHEVQHFALQVPNLREVAAALITRGLKPFQMDFDGNTEAIENIDGPLDFGLGTVFIRDPDQNLIEFLQLGHGRFQGKYIENVPAIDA